MLLFRVDICKFLAPPTTIHETFLITFGHPGGVEVDLVICQLDGRLCRRFNRIDCLLFAGFITSYNIKQ